MHKIILTDVDNTLLDYNESFQPWFEKEYGPTPYLLKNIGWIGGLLHETDVRDAQSVADDLCRRFSENDDLMGNLSPLAGAVEPVKKLHDRGYQFVAISACHDHPTALEARRANLERVFGFEWPQLHITGLNGCKASLLKGFSPSIWVEDHLQNAIKGVEAGHTTFLIDYAYNKSKDDHGVKRVHGWDEIERLLP